MKTIIIICFLSNALLGYAYAVLSIWLYAKTKGLSKKTNFFVSSLCYLSHPYLFSFHKEIPANFPFETNSYTAHRTLCGIVPILIILIPSHIFCLIINLITLLLGVMILLGILFYQGLMLLPKPKIAT